MLSLVKKKDFLLLNNNTYLEVAIFMLLKLNPLKMETLLKCLFIRPSQIDKHFFKHEDYFLTGKKIFIMRNLPRIYWFFEKFFRKEIANFFANVE